MPSRYINVVAAPNFNNNILEAANRINKRAKARNDALIHKLHNINESIATIAATNANLILYVLSAPPFTTL